MNEKTDQQLISELLAILDHQITKKRRNTLRIFYEQARELWELIEEYTKFSKNKSKEDLFFTLADDIKNILEERKGAKR